MSNFFSGSDRSSLAGGGRVTASPGTPAQDVRDEVSAFVRDFSIETTPAGSRRVADFRHHVATGTKVYVTALPHSDFGDIVATCTRLAAEGMVPVPHFAARAIADLRTLEHRLDRVTSEAGVTQVLAIAGSDPAAAGSFVDTISMLRTGLFEKYGIRSIGVTGHPEDAPGIDARQMREHEARKLAFRNATGVDMYIVTQFVFDAAPVRDFVERLRADGNDLPIVVGLPGPATIQSLIRYAKACGVGSSLRFLTGRGKSLRKLLSVEAPDRLARDLASFRLAHGDSGIRGMHIFPFGGFAESAAWANAVAAGDIELTRDGFTTGTRSVARAERGHS